MISVCSKSSVIKNHRFIDFIFSQFTPSTLINANELVIQDPFATSLSITIVTQGLSSAERRVSGTYRVSPRVGGSKRRLGVDYRLWTGLVSSALVKRPAVPTWRILCCQQERRTRPFFSQSQATSVCKRVHPISPSIVPFPLYSWSLTGSRFNPVRRIPRCEIGSHPKQH